MITGHPSSPIASDQGIDLHGVFNERPPRRIAVFRALFLGDLLCATPALRALHDHFPTAEITLIGLPWATDLVQRLPSLHRFVLFPGYPGIPEVPTDTDRIDTFFGDASATGYDLALQLHGSGISSNGFVAQLGATATLGYRTGHDHSLTVSLPWVEDEHETHRWLQLVALLGASTSEPRPDFPTTAMEQSRAKALLTAVPGDGPLIALHAGAKDPARRWPVERFAAVGDRLAARSNARILLTGGDGDQPLTAAVRQAMHHPALDLAGATDLGVFAALMKDLNLLITNDTGASHLAAAAGTPSVVLFGPSRPARWAPLDHDRHQIIDALAITRVRDPAAALATLPVDPVLAASIAMLTPRSQSASHYRPAHVSETLCAG